MELVINTFGTSLSKDSSGFVIIHKDGKQRIPVEGITSIQLSKQDLVEIQSFYDNLDSILIVPISTDYLQAMKVIGRTIDVDVITKKKNVLFF